MRRLLPPLLLHAALGAVAALTLLPLAWMVAVSLMPTGEAFSGGLHLLPDHPTLDHYRTLFARLDVARYALNSAFLAATITLVSLLLNAMAGYAFARLRFAGRDVLFRSLLAALVIPGQLGMLPLFLLLKELGLINTYAGVMIPGLASIFGIFLVRQYALSLPESILDAARVDGASELRVFWSIALPVCRPILTTLALFTFMGTWNDFLWPLIVLSDQSMFTLPVALANLLGEHAQDVELMMAGSVVTVVPMVALFLLLQRHYVAGVLAGSVKG